MHGWYTDSVVSLVTLSTPVHHYKLEDKLNNRQEARILAVMNNNNEREQLLSSCKITLALQLSCREFNLTTIILMLQAKEIQCIVVLPQNCMARTQGCLCSVLWSV